jgi:uncharacterized protein YyaL (SSP411 family)
MRIWISVLWMGASLAAPSGAANRLAGEASPYLRMHAENPVDWYPWGPEAFERARAESRPIFLSVGYSTCYWCHVMERKVFSDPEIAALMNRHFVNIKVDREERPDVDEVYMLATRILTGSGGWPNSVFLTAGREPFYAGTYFPPTDAGGRTGFPTVLRRINAAWSDDRASVHRAASRVTAAIARGSEITFSAALPSAETLLRRAREELARSYDAEHGGFRSRTKFPRPQALGLLLAAYADAPDPQTLRMVTHTLDQMALGGIHDHLAGGFHRYATEPTWSVPHFEKMLYDNAQLLSVYARAWELTGRPLYRQVVEDVVSYLRAEMLHPEGSFYSAQDAEVGHEEGASYVWSRTELEAALGPGPAREFLEVYTLAPMREHPGKGVLRVGLPLEERLERRGSPHAAALLAPYADARRKLLEVRNERPQPLRDDKVLTAWNGLAIRGLVDAAEALHRPEYLELAEAAARFVLQRLRAEDGTLWRSYILGRTRERAVLDDYAFFIDGLLALHAATGDPAWLAEARELTDTMLARYQDPVLGGFFLTVADHDLIVRPKPFEDGALPSGNGIALRVLRVLGARLGDERYRAAAGRTLSALSEPLGRRPSALASLVVALNEEPASPSAAARADAAAEPIPAGADRLPRSEDHVRVRLTWSEDAPGRVAVRMTIDEGWHVNANPASLPFLVPTRVDLQDGVAAAGIEYPGGRTFQPDFAPEPLRVYAGEVAIAVRLAEPLAAPLGASVRYQACDERSCLPPSVSRAEVARHR